MLLPTTESAFEVQHNFNPELIKNKGIKKITFEILDKKDFEVALDRNLVETYEFNNEGNLSRFYYTTISKTIERQQPINSKHGGFKTINEYIYDTISTSYFYSGDNLILKTLS